MNEQEIADYAKKILSEKRFKHSIGVMKRAGELAKIYGEDIEKARKIGLAHDIAKEFSKEENLEYIKKYNIEVDSVEKVNTGLLHGKIGAIVAKEKFDFDDEMCEAIRCHTTGKYGMNMLDKILFVADKTEYGRKYVNYDVRYERRLSNKNIDAALIYMFNETIKANIRRKRIIHPNTILARNFLLEKKLKSN